MKHLLRPLNARVFFTLYCPQVGNYTHKMRGRDGHGRPLQFTPEDKQLIAAALKQMAAEISKQLKNI